MSLGHLSPRTPDAGDRHHLWNNNGTWWVHYTLHFGHRKRRIRRSLKTRSLDEAIRRRDELFARIARDGEWLPERGDEPRRMLILCAARGQHITVTGPVLPWSHPSVPPPAPPLGSRPDRRPPLPEHASGGTARERPGTRSLPGRSRPTRAG